MDRMSFSDRITGHISNAPTTWCPYLSNEIGKTKGKPPKAWITFPSLMEGKENSTDKKKQETNAGLTNYTSQKNTDYIEKLHLNKRGNSVFKT